MSIRHWAAAICVVAILCPGLSDRPAAQGAGLVDHSREDHFWTISMDQEELEYPKNLRAIRESAPASWAGRIDDNFRDAMSGFCFKFLRTLDSQQTGRNLCASPLSVAVALAIALNGASGNTQQAIRETLGFTGLDQQEINQSYRDLLDSLYDRDSTVTLYLGASLWCRMECSINQAFADLCRQYISAEIRNVDFARADASDMMNAWVESCTHGRLNKIVPNSIGSLSVMCLLSAAYFKADWTDQFENQDTRPDWFYRNTRDSVECQMMQRQGRLRYLDNGLAQVVQLPYGNGNYNMTIMLPSPRIGIAELIAKLTPGICRRWAQNLKDCDIVLRLPRFHIERKIELKPLLSKMGMAVAFDSSMANFSQMVVALDSGTVFLDGAVHQTVIDVCERGTEAAAATVFWISNSGSLPPKVCMTVNRPFLFLIGEENCEIALFIGKVVSPS